MRRIVLSRTDAIGDLILTLPVARSIKEAYPECHLTMLVSEYASPLLASEPYLNEVLTLPGKSLRSLGEIRRLGRELRAHQADVIVFFYPRFSLGLASLLGGIKTRVGTAYRGYSFLFSHRIKLHRKLSGKHELDLNYDLADSIFPNLARHEPQLRVTEDEIAAAETLLAKHGIGAREPFMIIHPFSRGSAPNWRLANYLNLAQRLAEAGIRVILTGSGAEREMINAGMRGVIPGVISLAGATDLRQLKALIEKASLLVAGSTGPIHIAAAVGTFAVGIYPPIEALSPVRWGPRGGSNKLFVPDVALADSGCAEVMDAITVDAVFAYVLSKMQSDIRLG